MPQMVWDDGAIVISMTMQASKLSKSKCDSHSYSYILNLLEKDSL